MSRVPGVAVHLHHARARPHQREGQVGLVGAGDDGEPGAVDDLIHGRRGRHLRRLELGPTHRSRGVDDDDLPGITGPGLTGRSGSGAGHGDDGVDVGAAFWQELVLVHLGGELGHDQLPFRPGWSVQYACCVP